MGKRRVRILIKTLQQIQGQQERTEYEYTGHWMPLNGKYCLTYEEVMEEAQEEQGRARTLITYSGDSLVLKRKGIFAQQMEFLPRSRTRARYDVAVGSLPMEIETNEIALEAGEEKHRILLEYQLFSSGVGIGEYKMELEILFL